MTELKFRLGNKIKDMVSGVEGITTSFVVYMNGCIQWSINRELDKDGKPYETLYYDQQQCQLIDSGIVDDIDEPKQSTGGAPTRVRSANAIN
jgi:hypothetical protein